MSDSFSGEVPTHRNEPPRTNPEGKPAEKDALAEGKPADPQTELQDLKEAADKIMVDAVAGVDPLRQDVDAAGGANPGEQEQLDATDQELQSSKNWLGRVFDGIKAKLGGKQKIEITGTEAANTGTLGSHEKMATNTKLIERVRREGSAGNIDARDSSRSNEGLTNEQLKWHQEVFAEQKEQKVHALIGQKRELLQKLEEMGLLSKDRNITWNKDTIREKTTNIKRGDISKLGDLSQNLSKDFIAKLRTKAEQAGAPLGFMAATDYKGLETKPGTATEAHAIIDQIQQVEQQIQDTRDKQFDAAPIIKSLKYLEQMKTEKAQMQAAQKAEADKIIAREQQVIEQLNVLAEQLNELNNDPSQDSDGTKLINLLKNYQELEKQLHHIQSRKERSDAQNINQPAQGYYDDNDTWVPAQPTTDRPTDPKATSANRRAPAEKPVTPAETGLAERTISAILQHRLEYRKMISESQAQKKFNLRRNESNTVLLAFNGDPAANGELLFTITASDFFRHGLNNDEIRNLRVTHRVETASPAPAAAAA